uniref:C-X-C motif chemokine n=1 Tax=Suricata suricatta TaxID=37032 RepID=A0A673SU36_SURSU
RDITLFPKLPCHPGPGLTGPPPVPRPTTGDHWAPTVPAPLPRSGSRRLAATHAPFADWGGKRSPSRGTRGRVPSTPGRGRASLLDPGTTWGAGNFPRPPGIKGVLRPGQPQRPRRQRPRQHPASSAAPPPPRPSELSPMARAASPAAPRALRLLGAALLLLLLVPAGRALPAGAPVVAELRCQCLQTLQGIHLRNIQSVKVTPSGPHCAQTEVIATLKNGQEACLNPEAPMVKKIIHKMLSKGNTN